MSEPFIAEIKIVSFSFPPKGWAFCNGQTLAINQNQALFSLLGTTFGGNGQTTFQLPNLQNRVPIHPGNGLTLGGIGGESVHTLITNEMPGHIHLALASSNVADQGLPQNNFWAVTGSNSYSSTADSTMGPDAIGFTGNGQPHQNMPPSLVVNFVIALVGIFPSRN